MTSWSSGSLEQRICRGSKKPVDNACPQTGSTGFQPRGIPCQKASPALWSNCKVRKLHWVTQAIVTDVCEAHRNTCNYNVELFRVKAKKQFACFKRKQRTFHLKIAYLCSINRVRKLNSFLTWSDVLCVTDKRLIKNSFIMGIKMLLFKDALLATLHCAFKHLYIYA